MHFFVTDCLVTVMPSDDAPQDDVQLHLTLHHTHPIPIRPET